MLSFFVLVVLLDAGLSFGRRGSCGSSEWSGIRSSFLALAVLNNPTQTMNPGWFCFCKFFFS